MLLLLATNCGLFPQYLGVAGGSAEEEDPPGAGAPPLALPWHSLLPVDLHVILGARAHGDMGLLQEEGFEAHLHVFVAGHLQREMLLWAWFCTASFFPGLGGEGRGSSLPPACPPARLQGSEMRQEGAGRKTFPTRQQHTHCGVLKKTGQFSHITDWTARISCRPVSVSSSARHSLSPQLL